MKDPKKLSELIELHLELKGEVEQQNAADLESASSLEDSSLPPRREIFPSKKPRLTRIFYNTLFILFFILVIGLTVWGARMS